MMQQHEEKILVVDDDPDIGTMLKMMLEFKGHSAVVAESEEQADKLLKENHINLIIMDMLLSGANGTDICARLKKDPHYKKIPILMISAHPNAKEICLGAGATDFILKPFDMHVILSRVSALLNHIA
jgi:two-component system response regulator RpaA